MTIGEVITLICNRVQQRADFRLIGDPVQYELRYYEDDEVDYDLPPMSVKALHVFFKKKQ